MFSVHCAHTPTTAMTIACCGPSNRSAVRSAAYDTDSVDPLLSDPGKLTFQVDVMHEETKRIANIAGWG